MRFAFLRLETARSISEPIAVVGQLSGFNVRNKQVCKKSFLVLLESLVGLLPADTDKAILTPNFHRV